MVLAVCLFTVLPSRLDAQVFIADQWVDLSTLESGLESLIDLSDVQGCTDCLNATDIEDIYVLNSGDTVSGSMTITGSLLMTGTGSIGWTIVDQTDNQACTTGCTRACVAGQDLGGANKPLVSCSDTTADICLCGGGS